MIEWPWPKPHLIRGIFRGFLGCCWDCKGVVRGSADSRGASVMAHSSGGGGGRGHRGGDGRDVDVEGQIEAVVVAIVATVLPLVIFAIATTTSFLFFLLVLPIPTLLLGPQMAQDSNVTPLPEFIITRHINSKIHEEAPNDPDIHILHKQHPSFEKLCRNRQPNQWRQNGLTEYSKTPQKLIFQLRFPYLKAHNYCVRQPSGITYVPMTICVAKDGASLRLLWADDTSRWLWPYGARSLIKGSMSWLAVEGTPITSLQYRNP